MTEEVLAGGNMSGGVVRVGDTVRRPVGPQTPTIHRLLAHVRAQGVTWVPRVHGIDDRGREILDYIAGDVLHDQPAWLWDEGILVTVARRLREWHDATETFERTPDDVWWWQPGKVPAEVICHVDFAPYNHVFRDRRWVGAIDFDICYPGPRLWDLAYTAYRYVPLTPHVDDAVADAEGADRSTFGHAEQRRRLALFLDAYGPVERLEPGEPARGYEAGELLAWLPERLYAMADWCDTQEAEHLRRNGVMYRAHGAWIAGGGLGR